MIVNSENMHLYVSHHGFLPWNLCLPIRQVGKIDRFVDPPCHHKNEATGKSLRRDGNLLGCRTDTMK
jgi:hypothetical protein